MEFSGWGVVRFAIWYLSGVRYSVCSCFVPFWTSFSIDFLSFVVYCCKKVHLCFKRITRFTQNLCIGNTNKYFGNEQWLFFIVHSSCSYWGSELTNRQLEQGFLSWVWILTLSFVVTTGFYNTETAPFYYLCSLAPVGPLEKRKICQSILKDFDVPVNSAGSANMHQSARILDICATRPPVISNWQFQKHHDFHKHC